MFKSLIEKIEGYTGATGLGFAEEIAKSALRSVPVVGGLFHHVLDRAKDVRFDIKIQSLKEAKEKIQFGLTESKEAVNKLSRAHEELERRYKESDEEQKREILEQKDSLKRIKEIIELNDRELESRQRDVEDILKTLKSQFLTQKEKLERVELVTKAESLRIREFECKLSKIEEGLENLAEKIESEHKARQKLENDLVVNRKELEDLRDQIKKEKLNSSKLLSYKKLKQKRKDILLKLNKKEEIKSSDLIIENWLKYANINQKKSLMRMPLGKNSYWAKNYSEDQLESWGWQVVDDQENFQWLEIKIGQLIDENLKDIDVIFQAVEKEQLTKELALNTDLLLEICEELELKFPAQNDSGNTEKFIEEVKENKELTSYLNIFLYLSSSLLLLLFIFFFLRKSLTRKRKEEDESFSGKKNSNWWKSLFFLLSLGSFILLFFHINKEKSQIISLKKEVELLKETQKKDHLKLKDEVFNKLSYELSDKKDFIEKKLREKISNNQFEVWVDLNNQSRTLIEEFQRIVREIREINPTDRQSIRKYLERRKNNKE